MFAALYVYMITCSFFLQSGEGAPVNVKGTCARHVPDVAKLLRVSEGGLYLSDITKLLLDGG